MRTGFARGLLKPLLAAVLLPPTLAACASLAGAPPRVIGAAQSVTMANRYPMDDSIIRFHASEPARRYGLTPKQFRDMVITVHLNAADAQYFDFKTRVSSERREIGLGLDLVLLGFTNYASVARPGIVNDLSAAAAGFAGARGALDRNVYFDRSLPALLASMDAQRLQVRTRIAEGLRRSETDYPLDRAFDDVNAYQAAGTLDGAIQNITAQAVQERQEAERDYSNAVRACQSEGDLRVNRRRIMRFVVNNQPDPAKLADLAELMGLATTGIETNAGALRTAIQNELQANYCTNQKLEQLITRMRAQSMSVPDQ